MAHANENTLRRGYEAFSKFDLDTIRDLWSPDITWHSYGNSPFVGEYHGPDEIFAMFSRIPEETDKFQTDVHAILADDEHGVVMVDQVMRRGDRVYSGRAIHVFHFDRDGKVTEAFIQPLDEGSLPEDFFD
jgi:ketosteroid isomerase-like protein